MIKSNALKFGIFTLTSGKESPYYIDLRILPSFPHYFQAVIEAYKDVLIREIRLDSFEYLCSVPTSGLVYASSLAYEIGKPLIYLRKEAKQHGTNKLIEGYLHPGAEVLIVDDVVTTGSSIIECVEGVRQNGGVVHHAIVLIDRLEGADDALRKKDVRLISVAKITEIANVLFDTGMVEEEILKAVKAQVIEKS